MKILYRTVSDILSWFHFMLKSLLQHELVSGYMNLFSLQGYFYSQFLVGWFSTSSFSLNGELSLE